MYTSHIKKIYKIINIKLGGVLNEDSNEPINIFNKSEILSDEILGENIDNHSSSKTSSILNLDNKDSEYPFNIVNELNTSSNQMLGENINKHSLSETSSIENLDNKDSEYPFNIVNVLNTSSYDNFDKQQQIKSDNHKQIIEESESPFNISIIKSEPILEFEDNKKLENKNNDNIINSLDKDTISKINNINIMINKIGNETHNNNQQINFIKSNLENVTQKIDLVHNLEENIKNIFNCSDKKSNNKENIISDKLSNIQEFLIQNNSNSKSKEESEIKEKANFFKSKINEFKNESFNNIDKDLTKFDLVLKKLARLSKRRHKIKYNKINNDNDNYIYELKYLKYKYKYLEYKKNNNFI
jgi:hypothetical protein